MATADQDQDDFPTKLHIRHCLLYEFKRGANATQATSNINEVYGPVLNARASQHWFKRFRSGNLNLDDHPRPGRPKTFDREMLRHLVEQDPHQTIDQLARAISSSTSTVHRYLQEMGKTQVAGNWVDQA